MKNAREYILFICVRLQCCFKLIMIITWQFISSYHFVCGRQMTNGSSEFDATKLNFRDDEKFVNNLELR